MQATDRRSSLHIIAPTKVIWHSFMGAQQ